jgi:site-specific DNA-methyltransferase (adenine-specific)
MSSVIVGDCIDVLRKHFYDGHLPFDLIVTDPPYNIGIDYGTGKKADRRKDYVEWCREWIRLCAAVLTPEGSMWVISGQEYGAHIDIAMQDAGLTMRSRITWHETFGVQCANKFARTSRPIYYAVKDPKRFTFNREAVTVPSARQTKYNDRRASPGGKIMGDVWTINRVCGTFRERVKGVPTQLPEELVRRIIGVSSGPDNGWFVLDPFAGSGTVPAVAAAMGRMGCGIELNPEYAQIANRRIKQATQKAATA